MLLYVSILNRIVSFGGLWSDTDSVLRYSALSRISISRPSSTLGRLRSSMLVCHHRARDLWRRSEGFLLTQELRAGQLVAEYPFIYLMSKFPLTKLVGITV
jgi:hypothetical protein